MKNKKILTEGVVAKIIKTIFTLLGIDPEISSDLLEDPNIKKQINTVRKSLDNIKSAADWMQKRSKQKW